MKKYPLKLKQQVLPRRETPIPADRESILAYELLKSFLSCPV